MAKPKQKMDIKLHPEARRIIEGAVASGVRQAVMAEYAGVDANIISKILGEDRRLMASEFIDIVQGLGYQIEKPSPAVLPSVETIATILEVVLSAEKAGQVPKGDLTIYGTLVRTVLSDVASGELVEDDQAAIRTEMSGLIRKAFGAGPARSAP